MKDLKTHQDRSGPPDVLMGQPIVLSEIKAEVPLENDIPSHQNILLQRYEDRIKLLSQENKVSKFCMDAGFVHVVEVGQYFMTKDTGDFTQFHAVACREYTLSRDDPASQTTQNGSMTSSGLLKCRNLVKCWELERRDPYMTSLLSMMIWTLALPQNRTFL